MHAVATSGRWIWGLSGLATTAALVVSGTFLITSAGRAENAQPQSVATQTVTVPQPVTSLTVQSYGAPVEIKAGPVRRVQITETLMYDQQADGQGGPISVSVQPEKGGPSSVSVQPEKGGPSSVSVQPEKGGPSSVSAQPAQGGPISGQPAVVQSVSGGHLSLGDPACAQWDCTVGFAVIVPSDVTATVITEGGPWRCPGSPGRTWIPGAVR